MTVQSGSTAPGDKNRQTMPLQFGLLSAFQTLIPTSSPWRTRWSASTKILGIAQAHPWSQPTHRLATLRTEPLVTSEQEQQNSTKRCPQRNIH
ncbi:MAG: hypothetical protein H7836_14995 [Magnetococcus sp. YQC-3]